MPLKASAATAPGTDPEARLRSQLKSACEGFEAVFVRELLAGARSASFGDGILQGDKAAEITTTMHEDALADSIVKGGGMGVADMLQRQLWPSVRARAIASGELPAPATGAAPRGVARAD